MQDAPSARRPTDARSISLAGLAIASAFALLALVEAATAVVAPRRVATEADWSAAAAEVRAGFRPGDLIVFAPRWTDPVGRHYLGDFVTAEMAGRADESRFARIWEVSIRGARAPETRAPGVYPVFASRHGRVSVSLHTRDAMVTPLYDFTARLGDARVSQQGSDGGNDRPCTRDDGALGFRCANTRVERRTLEVEFSPRAGILAPADGALTTRIDFADVPLGNSLVGYTGMHDWHSRKFGAGQADFKVFVDGVQLFVRATGSHDGWTRFIIETLRYAAGRHAVRFEIAAHPGARERNLGFHVESRSEAPAAGNGPGNGGATP